MLYSCPRDVDYSNIVIFNDETNSYRIFENQADFLNHYSSLKYSHEVIYGWRPQRVRYDIDAKPANLRDWRGLIERIINKTLDIYYDRFASQVVAYFTEDDFIITNSSDENKISFHVIAPFYGANNADVLYFAKLVMAELPSGDLEFIDQSIYKTTQNFRLLEQAKHSAPTRVKRLFNMNSSNDTDEENTLRLRCLIGHYDQSRPVSSFTTGETPAIARQRPVVNLNQTDFERIIEPYTRGHELRYSNNGRYFYNRLEPTHCDICDRMHDKDNTLIINVAPEGSQPIFLRCRRAPSSFKVIGHLGPVDSSLYSLEKIINSDEKNKKEECDDDDPRESGERGSDIKTEYITYKEPSLRPFPADKPTILVRAPMKMGKTKTLINFINNHHKKSSIIFITFRQTFSRALENSLRSSGIEIANYMDIQDKIISIYKYPRAIIQVESLHRFQVMGMPAPNLLVLDESESIFEQFASGNIRDINAAFATLDWLVRNSGTIIAMDANLGERTRAMIQRMRPSRPSTLIINSFPNATGDKYYFIEKRPDWYSHLIAALTRGDKIAVFMNSLKEAQTLEHAARTETENTKKIFLYSSETTAAVKNQHFSAVHQYWGDLDLLICTPTVSAGVSFELPWFDCVYGYFSDQSCSVETSRQMIGRIRNVKRAEYFIHFDLSQRHSSSLPTEIKEIRTLMHTRRAFLADLTGGLSLDVPLYFTYDDEGLPRYEETALHYLFMLNIRQTNLSRLFFARKFVSQIKKIGAAYEILKPDATPTLDLRAIHEDVKDAAAREIAAAPTITEEEAEYYLEQMKSPTNALTPENIASLQKYNIERTYEVVIEPTHVEFVKKFGSYKDRAIYRNLREIYLSKSNLLTLEQVLYSMKLSIDPNNVLTTNHIFDRHLFACRFIRAIGFDSVFDENNTIDGETLYARLAELRPEIKKNYSYLCFISAQPIPKLTDNDISVLKIINAILKIYGAGIRKKQRKDSYSLEYPHKYDTYLKAHFKRLGID